MWVHVFVTGEEKEEWRILVIGQCNDGNGHRVKFKHFGFLVFSVFTHKIPFHPPRCRLAETRENAEAENEEHACLQKIGHDGYAGLQQAGLAALPHTFIFCPRSLQFQTLWSSPG